MMSLASSISKTTSAWAVGSGNGALDTGTIANNTWYHVYLIKRTDTGVVDVLISTSATSPTLPASYTLSRRIGAIRTNGSAQWIKFSQLGDEFLWDTGLVDINGATTSGTAPLVTLTVPTGVKVQALLRAVYTSATVTASAFFSSPDESDQAAGISGAGVGIGIIQAANGYAGSLQRVRTNTSGQIRHRAGGVGTLYATTYGWVDSRGKE